VLNERLLTYLTPEEASVLLGITEAHHKVFSTISVVKSILVGGI